MKRKSIKNNSKKKIIIVGILLILIIGFILAYTFLFNKETNNSNVKSIKVPNLVGEYSDASVMILEKLGLKYEIKEKVDDSKEDMIGKVYKQNISGKITKKKKVVLYVYVSNEKNVLPDVLLMKKEDAEDVLKRLGFNVLFTEVEDNEHDEGVVISMDPKSGSEYVKGTLIKLGSSKKKVEEEKEENNANNNSNSNTNPAPQPTPDPTPTPEPDPTPTPDPTPVEPTYTIKLTGERYIVRGYGPLYIYADVTPALPADKTLIWTVKDGSICTINSHNNNYSIIYPGYAAGSTYITATVSGTNYSASHEVIQSNVTGDLDGNGFINSIDAAILSDAMFTYSSPAFKYIADFNKDGKVNADDVSCIIDYYNSH